jgi:SAM-dependent methyltransferase
VIARLLEHGFQVTGSDFSPNMLQCAARQFPQASFIQTAINELSQEACYDGICSFNSLLYLDPIDLLNSIYHLHRALKPGGLIFLYAFDSGPDWRGEPFNQLFHHWMWTWHYSMEEAAGLLEEHGYFEVLDKRIVKMNEQDAERIARALEKQKQEEEEYLKRQEGMSESDIFFMPFIPAPIERSPYTYLVIARRCEKS